MLMQWAKGSIRDSAYEAFSVALDAAIYMMRAPQRIAQLELENERLKDAYADKCEECAVLKDEHELLMRGAS